MRAAVLEQFDEPLVVQDVPDPVPSSADAIVRTRASGMCQTDLRAFTGAIPTVELPRVIGHELAGEVVALGSNAAGVEEGDPVAAQLDIWCGTCQFCRTGKFDYCANLRRLGLEADGSHAEYVRIPARNLLPLPPEVSFEQGAAVPDAVGSAYHAVKSRAQLRVGQTIAIYGLGGLGLNAVQVAALSGATRIIAIARTPERRRLALELGATDAIDPDEVELVEAVREISDGLGVDAFIDLVGIEGSIDQAAQACKRGGRVVVVGYKVPAFESNTMRLVINETQIMGSRSSTRAEQQEAISLIAQGRLRPVVARRFALADVNDAYDELRGGSVIGRSVLVFP